MSSGPERALPGSVVGGELGANFEENFLRNLGAALEANTLGDIASGEAADAAATFDVVFHVRHYTPFWRFGNWKKQILGESFLAWRGPL